MIFIIRGGLYIKSLPIFYSLLMAVSQLIVDIS